MSEDRSFSAAPRNFPNNATIVLELRCCARILIERKRSPLPLCFD
jgi:hypothetical protein